MIKNFNDYIKEVNGTELIGPMGPGYGDTSLPREIPKTRIYEIDGEFITHDDYEEYKSNFLKSGGLINNLTGNVENDIFFIKSYMNIDN